MMKLLLQAILLLAPCTYLAMDITPQQRKAQETDQLLGGHHTHLAELIRSSDAEGVGNYLNAHRATLNKELFEREPLLLDMAEERVSRKLRLKNCNNYVVAIIGIGLGSLFSLYTLDYAQSDHNHELSTVGVGICSGILVGMGLKSCSFLKGSLKEKSPERRIVALLKDEQRLIEQPAQDVLDV